jgi:uncharacterized NAD-dependent epimerase/dehydratase family protein
MNIPKPYLIFLGDAQDFKQAKTAFGVHEWRPEHCVGQLRLPECKVDLGLANLTSAEAKVVGAKTFVIALSPSAPSLPSAYIDSVADAIISGLNIANPLHDPLPKTLIDLAFRQGVKIYNFRHRSTTYTKGTGEKRQGLRLLTVGTDCASGKKFTALSICRALENLNIPNTFRSTGQTGFLISGSGINNDTIQADFLSGAAEWLSPNNDAHHWDVVEGQGAVSHPSFAAGAVSLIHGTQPDCLVMCHEPGREQQRGVSMALPQINSEIELVNLLTKRTNPCGKVMALSLFTKYVTNKNLVTDLVNTYTGKGYYVFDPSLSEVNPDPATNFSAFINFLVNMPSTME